MGGKYLCSYCDVQSVQSVGMSTDVDYVFSVPEYVFISTPLIWTWVPFVYFSVCNLTAVAYTHFALVFNTRIEVMVVYKQTNKQGAEWYHVL